MGKDDAPELLAGVEAAAMEAVQAEFKRIGRVPGDAPRRIAVAVSDYLISAWGGAQVYFPKDIPRRNARIFDEFTGDNIRELAVKYKISDPWIYQILAAERERRRMKQLTLPGMVG